MKKIKNEWAICDFADACLNTVRVIIALVFFGFLVSVMILGLNDVGALVDDVVNFEELDQDIVYSDSGVGRVEVVEVPIYTAGAEVTERVAELSEKPTIEIYKEGDEPKPAWFNPDEPMQAVWLAPESVSETIGVGSKASPAVASNAAPVAPVKDISSPDWNFNTSIIGWGGRKMEVWEMDVFSRIFYLEFWQPNMMLCEAGCDAMLRMWELNGGTVYETLSHVNENGYYTYSTFPGMWDEVYDSDGLAWCREFCENRFRNGPVWSAQYFRKGQYHDWGKWSPIPAYEIGGIYFSVSKSN